MMTLKDDNLLRLMIREKAQLDMATPGDMYPAYPNGDKRKRPVAWIDKATVKRFEVVGGLDYKGTRASISDTLRTRLSGDAPGAHQDVEEREVYTPSGTLRPVRVNHRNSALRSLARKCKPSGEPFLSKAQVEAGEQFARDYGLSGMGFVAGQDVSQERVDGTRRSDGQELAIISRMDRRKRVSEAISCLGPGLDRAAIAVCCENYSTEQLERTEKWVKHSGRTVLIIALDRLVAFYGTLPGER